MTLKKEQRHLRKKNLSPPPSKQNNNNTSTADNNQATDEQLAKDLFATPKPKVVIEPPKTTVTKASELKKPETEGNTSQADASEASSSSLPTNKTNIIDPDEYIHHEDIEENMDYEDAEKDYIVVAKPTAYALAATILAEPKKHPKDILKMVNEAFLGKDSFQGANIRRVNLIKSVIVYFDNKTDMDDASDCII